MGKKRTLSPFSILQLFFQNILIRFSAFASLESKKETLRYFKPTAVWSLVDVLCGSGYCPTNLIKLEKEGFTLVSPCGAREPDAMFTEVSACQLLILEEIVWHYSSLYKKQINSSFQNR